MTSSKGYLSRLLLGEPGSHRNRAINATKCGEKHTFAAIFPPGQNSPSQPVLSTNEMSWGRSGLLVVVARQHTESAYTTLETQRAEEPRSSVVLGGLATPDPRVAGKEQWYAPLEPL
jgi:hypothetical protein